MTDHRTLEGHKINPANDNIRITVLDEPGAGGAHHHYMMTLPDWTRAPDGSNPKGVWDIQFQNGPISEAGINGVTHEALLAILIDRMECFQAGPYANDYNAAALSHLQSAQGCLLDRTRERVARGVEGTHQK